MCLSELCTAKSSTICCCFNHSLFILKPELAPHSSKLQLFGAEGALLSQLWLKQQKVLTHLAEGRRWGKKHKDERQREDGQTCNRCLCVCMCPKQTNILKWQYRQKYRSTVKTHDEYGSGRTEICRCHQTDNTWATQPPLHHGCSMQLFTVLQLISEAVFGVRY